MRKTPPNPAPLALAPLLAAAAVDINPNKLYNNRVPFYNSAIFNSLFEELHLLVDPFTVGGKDLGEAIKYYSNNKSLKNLSTAKEDKYKLVSNIIRKFKEDNFNNKEEFATAFYQWKIFKLCFSYSPKEVCNKLAKKLYLIRTNFNRSNGELEAWKYKVWINSYITYSIEIKAMQEVSDKKILEKYNK